MLIYATKPVSMVIGEAEVELMISEQPEKLWELAYEDAGISKRWKKNIVLIPMHKQKYVTIYRLFFN